MKRIIRRFKRASFYKKTLFLFTCVLVILGGVFLGYVWNSMVIYERSLVDNYIKYLADSGKLAEYVDDNLFAVSEYEDLDVKISDGAKKIFKSNDLSYKKNSKESKDNIYVYDIYTGNRLISTVSLKNINTYTKMAILTINEWEIVENINYFDKGIYNYEIILPKDYNLYINDSKISDDEIIKEGDVVGLERLTEHIEINKSKTYEITNLVYEPNIKILDENKKEVNYKIDGNKIVVSKNFLEIEKLKDAKEYIKDDFDILKLAENWSLFLTDDLSGSYHGFNKLTPYLIEDSYMYEMAYGWSHNVDITFVSSHRLKNPVFTNEEVKNFIIYNDNAFSCEVYLEKNMIVSGKDKVDIMHDRLYFIYYEDGYKLVNMESI